MQGHQQVISCLCGLYPHYRTAVLTFLISIFVNFNLLRVFLFINLQFFFFNFYCCKNCTGRTPTTRRITAGRLQKFVCVGHQLHREITTCQPKPSVNTQYWNSSTQVLHPLDIAKLNLSLPRDNRRPRLVLENAWPRMHYPAPRPWKVFTQVLISFYL